jgi:hypothetical protein
MNDEPCGEGAACVQASTAKPSACAAPINSRGPRLPALSKRRATRTRLAHGCDCMKARAPIAWTASASVNTNRMSLSSGGPACSTRMVSSSAAAEAAPSAAPGVAAPES